MFSLLRPLAACSLLILTLQAGTAAAIPRESRVPGGVALLTLGPVTPGEREPKVFFDNQRVLVTPRYGDWLAVIGLPLDLSAGEHKAVLDWHNTRTPLAFTVTAKDYPVHKISLSDPAQLKLSADDRRRAELEMQAIDKLKAQFRETTWPGLDFRAPVPVATTDRFGSWRQFSKKHRTRHSGLDYAAAEDTEILAPAAGTIVAIGNHLYSGNTVVIDHGQGLISLYAHLKHIYVQPTTTVKAGTRIGTIGQTGRATEPHLHWSVLLNGTAVDPELFLSNDLATFVDPPNPSTLTYD